LLDAARASAVPSDGVLIVAIAAPVAPAALVFADYAHHGEALVWAREKSAHVGLGSVAVLEGRGPERFAEIRRQADELFGGVRMAEGSVAWQPRVFGGFAFRVGGASAGAWQTFGDARFVLPRFSYSTDGVRATLALALRASDLEERSLREWEREMQRLVTALGAPSQSELTTQPSCGLVRSTGLEATEFHAAVDSIRSAIREGRMLKVVAARCRTLTLEDAIEPHAVWAQLKRGAGDCTCFGFHAGGTTFVGSTPERLVECHGRDLYTEAVAGTIRSGATGSADSGSADSGSADSGSADSGSADSGSADSLLASKKDREEHNHVVSELTRLLEPIAESVRLQPEPSIRRLRYALHLHTPIHATLREDCHVLEVVERLHPTPAVAGLPSAEALRWIDENEQYERGWYSGPVGWFTADGHGAFWVGLRSGLLSGNTARIYAGAGIVQDSNGPSEYAETQLKMEPLLSALGVALA
jgi:menaquinone-specific isochorismate synthase